MEGGDYGLIMGLIISYRVRADIAQALLAGTDELPALAAAGSVTEEVALKHLGRFQAAGGVVPVADGRLLYRLTKVGRAAALDALQPIPPFKQR